MFDSRKMRRLMKQAGVKMDEIEAEEVIIKTPDEEYVFKNPEVAVISAAGQKTFQLSGNYTTRRRKKEIPEEDVKMVMEQAQCGKEEAEKALRECDGDIAAAILELSSE
jgi:nascent polypeptide-associated complex subunit alpha